MIFIITGIVVILLLVLLSYVQKSNNCCKWIDTEDFRRCKKALTRNSDWDEFEAFMTFLKGYGGGHIERKSGEIVVHEFLNKEKTDLKGIFFNLVIPNPNIPVSRKEEFRRYLISIGVTGLDKRPEYESKTFVAQKVDEARVN